MWHSVLVVVKKKKKKKISHKHGGPLRGSSSPFLALGAGEG